MLHIQILYEVYECKCAVYVQYILLSYHLYIAGYIQCTIYLYSNAIQTQPLFIYNIYYS